MQVFLFFLFFTKSSISAVSQVGLFRFSSNTWEAALNNRSPSTLEQGAHRYYLNDTLAQLQQTQESGSYLCASNITPTAVRFSVSVFLFVVLVPTVFHTNDMFANDYKCSVHAGTLPEKSAEKDKKTVPIYGWSISAFLVRTALRTIYTKICSARVSWLRPNDFTIYQQNN